MHRRLSHVSRREFLSLAAATTATAAVSSNSYSAANDRMKVAFIGVGGRGGSNLGTIAATDSVDVVGLCDVDQRFLDNTGEKYPRAEKFRDFRKLYDAIGKNN